jgi:hypothetical protein
MMSENGNKSPQTQVLNGQFSGVETSVSPGSGVSFEKGSSEVKGENGIGMNIKSPTSFLETGALPPLKMPFKDNGMNESREKNNGMGDMKIMSENRSYNGVGDVKLFTSESREKEGGVQVFNNSYNYLSEYQYYYTNGQMRVEYENGRKDININPFSGRRNQYLPFPIDECMQSQSAQTSFPDKDRDIKKSDINDDIEEIDLKNNKPSNVIKKRKRTLKNNWNKMTEALFKQMLEY